MTEKYFNIGTTMAFDGMSTSTVTAASMDRKIELYRNGVKKADLAIPVSGTTTSAQIGETGEYYAVRTLSDNTTTFRTNYVVVSAVNTI